MTHCILIILTLIVTFMPLAAESDRNAVAYRTKTSIRCDAWLDEEDWLTAPVLDSFTQRLPNEGYSATQRTELRFVYNEKALFIAVKSYDSEPDKILTPIGRRDQWIMEESDWVQIAIDSNHDRRTAYSFFITAGGSVVDGVYYNDDQFTSTWDGVWKAETRITSTGWLAEVCIPFYNFQYTPADSVWGLQVGRYISQNKESVFLFPFGVHEEGFVSRFGNIVGIRTPLTKGSIEFLPHVTGRSVVSSETSSTSNQQDLLGNLGADLRISATSNFILYASANPDFGQVESDPAVLNLTVFETFFEERRPFFSKDAQIFDTPISLFYSRRIGRRPDLFPTPSEAQVIDRPDFTNIIEATKITGRTPSGTSLGLLQALASDEYARISYPTDARPHKHLIEPRTHYTVARLKHDVLKRNSHIGGLFTAVNRSRGSNAYTAATDWKLNWSDNMWRLTGQFAASHIRNGETGAAINVGFTKQGGSLEAGVTYESLSPHFEANDLGFIRRGNLHRIGPWVAVRGYRPLGFLRRRSIELESDFHWNYERLWLEKKIAIHGRVETNRYWWLEAGHSLSFPAYDDLETRGGPPILQPRVSTFWTNVNTDNQRPIVAETSFSLERNTSGSHSRSVSVDARWRVNDHLSIRTGPNLLWEYKDAQWLSNLKDYTGDGTDHIVYGELTTRVVEWTTRFDLLVTPKTSLQLFMQPFVATGDYGMLKELVSPDSYHFAPFKGRLANPDFRQRSMRSNLVFRWEYSPGSVMFLVWSQSRSASYGSANLRASDVLRSFTDPGDNIWLAKLYYHWVM